jgi:hypothetical protein
MSEEPTYHYEADDMRGTCVGDDALLYILRRYREKPITVTRTDWPPVTNHYVEEWAVQVATTGRT